MFAGAESPRDARQKMVCMRQYQIAVIVGSLRRESINRKLATALVGLAPAEFAFVQLDIGDLPLYNQDDDNPSESVKRLKSAIAERATHMPFETAWVLRHAVLGSGVTNSTPCAAAMADFSRLTDSDGLSSSWL